MPDGGHADDGVARRAALAGDDASSATVPDAGAHEVEARRRGVAADQLGQLGQLAAGDLDAGLLGAGLQAERDVAQHVGLGALDGEVVEQRQRLGADADRGR